MTALPRVVLVGFNKCATRSLAGLFQEAGHRVLHFRLPGRIPGRWVGRRGPIAAEVMHANLQAGRRVFEGFEDFTFYSDMIFVTDEVYFEGCTAFREILRDYPDAILLLNTRNREDWIASRIRHGHGEFVARSLRVLNLPDLAALKQRWAQDWDEHLAAVRSFMADRPGQLVEFDIDRDRVEDLCAALPAYRLDPANWGDTGRSRGRKRQGLIDRIARLWAHHRPR